MINRYLGKWIHDHKKSTKERQGLNSYGIYNGFWIVFRENVVTELRELLRLPWFMRGKQGLGKTPVFQTTSR